MDAADRSTRRIRDSSERGVPGERFRCAARHRRSAGDTRRSCRALGVPRTTSGVDTLLAAALARISAGQRSAPAPVR